MGTTVRSDSTADREIPAVKRGIVSRRELFERLKNAERVVNMSAPPGSGKRLLLRSWIAESGLEASATWVSVPKEERDAQRFWISVADALRSTKPGFKLVTALTPAPDLDGWAIVERLLADLEPLDKRIWLVIDDLHELRADEALRQLELFLIRAPATLRFILLTRRDMRLGFHRLRLDGDLTEIRAADLRFTLAEARNLFEAAGVQLSDSALQRLLERTEGWVAGLRLAALSLRGQVDPEKFAAEFSGTERTVADYLLAEVLERQSEEVRRLLLRTSICERVSGPLADALTGGTGGERILQELEEANAFVISLDAQRSWFRYHRLFADLLQLELRRTQPAEIRQLHNAASDWYAQHGYPIDAIHCAQAAQNWDVAARLLFDNWLNLQLDGRPGTARELVSRFPAAAAATNAEVAAMKAADQMTAGSIDRAEADLALATRHLTSVAEDRRPKFEISLALARLTLARRRGNLPEVLDQAERLVETAGSMDTSLFRYGDDLRVFALLSVGIAELWSNRSAEADRHLEEAVREARRINRPYLEINALGQWALLVRLQSFALAQERSRLAIEIAQRHGWSDAPVVFGAYVTLGNTLAWQGRLDEGEYWLDQAERIGGGSSNDPQDLLILNIARGFLETMRGHEHEALARLQAAERFARSVVTPHTLATQGRAFVLGALVRLGETEAVEQAFADMDKRAREHGDMRAILAALRLAQGDARAADAALEPVIDGSAPVTWPIWMMRALVMDAIAKDALGDVEDAHRCLERALDVAEPYGAILPFLLHPAPILLERHMRRRTAHAALVSEILSVLRGQQAKPARSDQERLREPVSESERRILRYLPTNLSVPEIADQTYLSVNTVKTHMRHLYGKLGAHSRGQAVDRARGLGLLAPSGIRPTNRA